MHTGSPEELRDMERRALQVGQRIAALLDELERIAPGSVVAQVSGLGFTIRRRGSGFVAAAGR
ncbi:hypothetical protein [Streptomyces sp. NPDC058108]|uniref:hypothetical protein n=1 Tax=Streptomyces sp. NPDC058108 TaxID=3346344 RepID=UPI0036E290AB